MLSIELKKKLGDIVLDVAFAMEEGGITAIFGPSGAGKSTLLNCVAGLLRPEEGRITCGKEVYFDSWRGICLPPEKRRLGYVFQEGRLFPHLSVQSNLLFGQRFRKPRRGAPKLEEVTKLLDVGNLLSRRPTSLSGGEKQRVALGRALLGSPDLLLMDEPLAALDPSRKHELMEYISRIPEVWGISILYVTHSPQELRRLARQVLLLEGGAMTGFGPAESLDLNPQGEFHVSSSFSPSGGPDPGPCPGPAPLRPRG